MRTDVRRYAAWTPATDTHELPAVMRGCPPTTELPFWMPRPSVPTVHLTLHAKARRRWHRIRGSQYVAEVRAGWARALAVLGVLGIAYFLLLLVRGAYVAVELSGLTR